MHHKKQNLCFYSSNIARSEVSCKKGILKRKILQNLLKHIRDAIFNLIKFQTKGLQLYWKETPAYALFVERRKAATSAISSEN